MIKTNNPKLENKSIGELKKSGLHYLIPSSTHKLGQLTPTPIKVFQSNLSDSLDSWDQNLEEKKQIK